MSWRAILFGRICPVFDYLGKALAGSTDIRASDPDTVACDEAEIDYFLESMSRLFPGLSFCKEQTVFAYSGIRPLPASAASTPGLIRRDHSAPVMVPDGNRSWPVISLVGGKWMTARSFAEDVADLILKRLAIGGGRDFPLAANQGRWIQDVAERTGSCPMRVAALLYRYGSKAVGILDSERMARCFSKILPIFLSRRLSGWSAIKWLCVWKHYFAPHSGVDHRAAFHARPDAHR